jgi:hypothetical protein
VGVAYERSIGAIEDLANRLMVEIAEDLLAVAIEAAQGYAAVP